MSGSSTDKKKSRLIHESLLHIPQQIRFLATGALSNLLFLTGYQIALRQLHSQLTPSSIYSLYYLCYIPVGHALTSLLVFGWPEEYLKSLGSTVPVGLTAMALGTVCTAVFVRVNFDEFVDDLLINNFGFLYWGDKEGDVDVEGKYSSVAVMIITGVWTYVGTMIVMGEEPPKAKESSKEETFVGRRKSKKE